MEKKKVSKQADTLKIGNLTNLNKYLSKSFQFIKVTTLHKQRKSVGNLLIPLLHNISILHIKSMDPIDEVLDD